MKRKLFGKLSKKTAYLLVSILLLAGAVAVLFGSVIRYTKEDGYEYLIGLSQPDLTDHAQLVLYNETAAACDAEDMRLIAFDAGKSTTKQVRDVRTLREIGVDAMIIVSENAEAMADVISEAYHDGIEVILIGSAPVSGEVTCNIVPDRYQAGHIAGEYTAELAGGKTCTVLEIQGEAKSRVSKELQRGFLDAVSGMKNITKEYVMTGYWTQVDTQERLNESHFFSREPKIDLIFAHNDAMALAAAAEADEKESGAAVVSVGGYDFPGSDLEAVRDGRIKATVCCPAGGKEAVELAVRIIREKEMPPETVFLKPVLVTQENVEGYLRQSGAENAETDPDAVREEKENEY